MKHRCLGKMDVGLWPKGGEFHRAKEECGQTMICAYEHITKTQNFLVCSVVALFNPWVYAGTKPKGKPSCLRWKTSTEMIKIWL